MKKVLPYLFLVLTGCQTHYEVKSYYEWCAHETSEEYSHPTIATTYDYSHIRESFIKHYNDMLEEGLLMNHFWDSTVKPMEDVRELIEDRKVGVWREGNVLHFANEHMTSAQFRKNAQHFGKLLDHSSLAENHHGLNEHQLCLYKTIDQLFAKVVLHNGTEEIEVAADFSFKEQFQ